VPRKPTTFKASLLLKCLRFFHRPLEFSIYWTMSIPPKLPMKDHPSIVHTKSLLACMYFIVPSSLSEWNAILGLSLYFYSSSSSFFYLLVLCSRCGLSNVYGPSTWRTLIFLASSSIFYLIASLSTALCVSFLIKSTESVAEFWAILLIISPKFNFKFYSHYY